MTTIKATSNERHRLKKLMNGEEGSTYSDALCEKIDDSLDAKATEVKSTFEGGNLRSIHNNGRPMNEHDRISYIQLDSEKPLCGDSDKQIGCKGIGSMVSRAKFCGETGKETTVSIGEDVNWKCEIDMGALLDENETPEQCWTADSEHIPQWNLCDEEGLKKGVITQYTDNSCKHNFDKQSTITNHMNTYSEYINRAIVIKDVFDGDTYTIPQLVNPDNVDTVVYPIERYTKENGSPVYRFTLKFGGMKMIGRIGAGYGEVKKYPSDDPPINTTFEFQYPKIKDIITGDMHTSKDRHYAFMNSLHTMSDNITLEGDNVIINCGEHNLVIPVEENNNKVTDKTNRIKELLFNGVSIKQDDRVLSSETFSIYNYEKRSGDLDKQDLYEYGRSTWNVSSNDLDIRLERKKYVNIKQYPGLEKVFSLILKDHNTFLSKNMEKHHKSLLSEEQKKKAAAEKKKAAAEKKKKKADAKAAAEASAEAAAAEAVAAEAAAEAAAASAASAEAAAAEAAAAAAAAAEANANTLEDTVFQDVLEDTDLLSKEDDAQFAAGLNASMENGNEYTTGIEDTIDTSDTGEVNVKSQCRGVPSESTQKAALDNLLEAWNTHKAFTSQDLNAINSITDKLRSD
jgi:hypothetical protein